MIVFVLQNSQIKIRGFIIIPDCTRHSSTARNKIKEAVTDKG